VKSCACGDVARVELAAGDYTLRSRLDGQNAAAIGIFEAPNANALADPRPVTS
jgi:multidrug efflux pump